MGDFLKEVPHTPKNFSSKNIKMAYGFQRGIP
jgi:hypothetical protein